MQSSNITRLVENWLSMKCRMYWWQLLLYSRILKDDMSIVFDCSRSQKCSLWRCNLWNFVVNYFLSLFFYHQWWSTLCLTFDSYVVYYDIIIEYIWSKHNVWREISSELKMMTWKLIHNCLKKHLFMNLSEYNNWAFFWTL